MNTLSRVSILSIGFGIGFALAAAWFLGAPDAVQNLSNTTHIPREEELVSIPQETDRFLTVPTQPAGSTVMLNMTTVPELNIWVAVHEMLGNELGNVLGAARIRDSSPTITIPLLRDTESGRLYSIVLYRDNGDNLFSRTDDSVYIDFETGKRVSKSFRTQP